MNRKQFIVLVVVVAIVGAAGWAIYQRGNTSWQSAGQTIGDKLLPNLPVNEVTQVIIASGTNQLTLEKYNDVWSVRERGDYPANFSQLSDLLVKLVDLKAVQHELTSPSQLARFNLSPPSPANGSGMLIELKEQNDKTLASLLLGKDHMNQPANGQGWADGRYVIVNNDNSDVVVISEPFDNVTANPADWLDKSFVKISNPKSIEVTFPEATNSWKLTRASETNDWQLADARPAEKLDSSKVGDITGSFDSLSFNDVARSTAEQLKDAVPVTVETFSGTNYVLQLLPSKDDNDSMTVAIYRANGERAPENEYSSWIYQIPSESVESLLKPRSSLLLQKTAAKSN